MFCRFKGVPGEVKLNEVAYMLLAPTMVPSLAVAANVTLVKDVAVGACPTLPVKLIAPADRANVAPAVMVVGADRAKSLKT